MKNLMKFLVLVLLIGALCVGIVLGVAAEGEYTGTVEELTAKVEAVTSAESATEKLNALITVAEYLPTVAPDEEGYEDAVATVSEQALALAKELLALVEDTEVASTARNQIAVNNLSALLKLELCDAENEEYKELVADFETRKALQDEAKEAARQAMLAQGTLSDYSMSNVLINDFTSNHDFSLGNKGSNTIDTAGGYLTVTYGAQDTQNTYVQKNFDAAVGSKGIVVDFDFTTFGNMPPNFHLEGGGHEGIGDDSGWTGERLNGKPKVYASYFKILANGDVTSGDGDGTRLLLQNAVTRGEWMHYTCIYNPVDFTYSLYCEYELLATYSAKRDGFAYNLSATRFAASTKETAEWSVDNVQIYQGTALRDIGIFERMTPEQTFVYYANYYTNDSLSDTLGRYTAYNEINDRISTYLDEEQNFIPFEQPDDMSDDGYAALTAEVQQAIADVLSFDESAFIAKMRVANTETLIQYVNDAKAIERSLTAASVNDRGNLVDRIDSFLKSASDLFETTEEYDVAYAEYVDFKRRYNMDVNILDFNDYMLRYSRVETVNMLEKYYNLADAAFNDADAPIDGAVAELPGFEEFKHYYEIYLNAVDRIENVKKDNNAKTIIGCYELISGFAPADWEANYDYINPYVVMIRQTIAEDYYNYDYEGIDAVISAFTPMDEYFYALLQQVHINEISECLDYVYNNDAYVEKMGTLSYVGRYLDGNDIDYTNPEIARLIVNYETALAELNFREEDYNTVLVQNASYFVSLVEKMRITDDFNTKRELYNQAIGFYFALDATVEGAKEAIAVFDEHTLWFEKGEQSSVAFIEAVAILATATNEDERYAALVQCYVYSLDAVLTYDGVASAMELYTAEYEAYNDYANSANAVIDVTGETVAAVRANCGVKPVVAVIVKKLFD